MTHPIPDPTQLDHAEAHRWRAEQAAGKGDYTTALRERFRALLRGAEQYGLLPVRRSRTAHETAIELESSARTASDDELASAASLFDEVVYGTRPATASDYQQLARLDRFSDDPPPSPSQPTVQPARQNSGSVAPRWTALVNPLANPRFWAWVIALALVVLLVWAVAKSCSFTGSAPSVPTPKPTPGSDLPSPSEPPDMPTFTPRDSIFQRLPAPVAFGGLQFLLAVGLLLWWRGRRRGAPVGEPQPVQVAAEEVLDGHARWYRRAGDWQHLADILRRASVRRLCRRFPTPHGNDLRWLSTALSTRTGLPEHQLAPIFIGPVVDRQTLERVALQLQWIEAETL